MQISVIIPTYRPENYLFECLDTLRAQTLPVSQWEGIIVLNGCDEPWQTQIKDYLRQHHITNIRLLQTDQPGVSNARNMGLDAAQGEYIAFIDDDDYVSDVYLKQLAQIATPDTIAASYTRAFSDETDYIPYYIEQEYNRHAKEGKMPFYKARKYFSGPCMKLIHRDIIGQTRFNTAFQSGEDSLFMFEISNRLQFIQFTPQEAVYYRRMRSNSASNRLSHKQTIKNCWQMIRTYTRIYRDGKSYLFRFYITRLLGAIHTVLDGIG